MLIDIFQIFFIMTGRQFLCISKDLIIFLIMTNLNNLEEQLGGYSDCFFIAYVMI